MTPELGDTVIYTPSVCDLHVFVIGLLVVGAVDVRSATPHDPRGGPMTWRWPWEVPGSRAWRERAKINAMAERLDAIKKGDADG